MIAASIRRLVIAAVLASVPCLVVRDAEAVGTRTFVLDTHDKMSGGDLKGVAVGSDGNVRAGFNLGSTPVPDAAAVFAVVALADGSTLIGTSPNGKVYKAVGETVTLYAETNALAVTSLVQAKNGAVYAATMPDGKIFKLSQGKADAFATLPDASNVWSLAADKTGNGLYAAAGPEGKVFHIEATGTASVYFRSTETNLVSVAVAPNGDVYAGSSPHAQLYKITGPGRATVIGDLPGDETKALAVAADGTLWAIANENGEPTDPPKRGAAAGRVPPSPTPTTKAKPGKGHLFRYDPQGRSERIMKHDDTHYMSLALDDKGQPYVGTGAEGRVYTVDDAHTITLVADTDERSVGALLIGPGGKSGVVATSDPPVLHRILGKGGADAVWTSKVLDATLRAHFGTLSWRSNGALEVSFRTGGSGLPDATWTGWSNPLPGPTPMKVHARYVQVRARFSKDPNASLAEVTIPFVTDNARAVVTEVNAVAKGGPAKEPAKDVPASGGEPGKHDAVVKLSWKVENPDNDALRYRVTFKKEGHTEWRDVLKPEEVQTKAELDWDTANLPEGKYKVRVEASDEPSNPPESTQKHALESDTITVDNTAPRIDQITLTGRKLRVHVVDGTSPILRVELSIDGKSDWRPLAAQDGIYDTADEHVDSDVSSIVPPGSHIVVVRAFDTSGNSVTRDVEAK